MSKYFDLIATVDIDLTQPIVEDTTFDNLLIVGPLPKNMPAAAPAKVGIYENLVDVENAGWVTNGEDADPVGIAARIAFAQIPTPDLIYIAPIQMTEAEDGSDPAAEKAVATVERAIATPGWYGLCTAGVDTAEYEDIAAFIENQTKMFGYTEVNCFDNAEELCSPVVSDKYFRTFGITGMVHGDQEAANIPEVNKYLAVAFMTKWLSYQSGSETAAFKVLNTVDPSEFSSGEIEALGDKNLNYYVTIGNRNVTLGGKVMAGEWMDIIRFRDWQKNDMQKRVVDLFIANPKIPYTDAGIALVQNQMLASLKAGQDIGGIAPDEYDESGALVAGYTTSVPTSASITATEKATRRLTNCKFKARLAGAIHFAEIKGSLTYSL